MSAKIKAKVQWMGGDRVDGYYYIQLVGTDFILCQDGHPNFPCTFSERDKDSEKKAKQLCRKINK